MIFWKQARPYFLAVGSFVITVFLLKSIIAPEKKALTEESFAFPTELPLPGWRFQSSKSLNLKEQSKKGQVYQYTRNHVNLKIEMIYRNGFVTNELPFRIYNPNIAAPNKLTGIIRQHPQVGAYSLIFHKGRAYLHSCINPNAPSVVTYQQFIFNRYTYDLQIHRLLSALLGQKSLRDARCLWTHLSIPVENSSIEEGYQILENAWFLWYPHWHSRFP
ncbi:hypothetical protein NOS3756_47090 [Nostoc sp. NIES-3756]|uniref:cyanoexosortase A system-associated protein n=1 Tax=Nostoc sp. NIES-3756 TaxID=1751286 RepID=UPI00071F6762|nr:cyanoexosortase A system-associated protein [Nostoc sp. NIES-3756]BAT55716.1 hypothetical protein NOS3756_47090 [Nostoc sp. NIES-3756]